MCRDKVVYSVYRSPEHRLVGVYKTRAAADQAADAAERAGAECAVVVETAVPSHNSFWAEVAK